MIYILNADQKEIIKTAVSKHSNISTIDDLKRTGFYEALVLANEHQIPKSLVTRQIAYIKCHAQNDVQLAQFRRTGDYTRFVTWAAHEIELTATSLWLDMETFKDKTLENMFFFIFRLSLLARELASKRKHIDEKMVSESEVKFQEVLKTSMSCLGIDSGE